MPRGIRNSGLDREVVVKMFEHRHSFSAKPLSLLLAKEMKALGLATKTPHASVRNVFHRHPTWFTHLGGGKRILSPQGENVAMEFLGH
eukprot:TRINITY_DN608_c0_g1_i2.p2 TRINITY_DN608_c0_g1~~TRINITY_DN608_c0_g1_i2.p2  ORF type:complete len:88 (-),score=1.78 TRINITY_DN608_c0_g1_i2:168-431(-)